MSNTEFLEASNLEVQLFIEGRTQMIEFEVEQGWDYTRHIMSSIYSSMVKNVKPDAVIRLKRDGKTKELTKYEKQQLSEWSKQMDAEMFGK